MNDISSRPYAPATLGGVALATGAVAAARSLSPSIIPRTIVGTATVGGLSFGVGALAGLGGEAAARGLDAITPLDRTQSHLAIAAGGLATSLIAHRVNPSLTSSTIASVGSVLAVTGAAGAALDGVNVLRKKPATAPEKAQTGDAKDKGGIPKGAIIAGVAGVAVLGVGVVFGRKAITAAKNTKLIAASGPEADAVGKALGELIPRSKLPLPGRMFLEGRVPGLAAEPVRTYIPMSLDGKSLADRTKLAVDSMVQQGAFNKSRIVIGSPTGTGGFNPVPVAMDELLAKGDTAWVVSQYSKLPSVLSLNKTDEAVDAFMEVTRQVAAKRTELYPAGGGPKLYAAATSLGAHTLHAAALAHGDELFGSAVDMRRMLLLGAPEHMTKFTPASLAPGVVGRFRTPAEVAKITPGELDKMRMLEFAHSNDPVRLIDFKMGVQRPAFFDAPVPEGLAAGRPFTPGVSFIQHANDVTGAISKGTGAKIGSTMHDYRGDVQRSVRAAFDHMDVSDANMEAAAKIAQKRASEDAARIRNLLAGKGV